MPYRRCWRLVVERNGRCVETGRFIFAILNGVLQLGRLSHLLSGRGEDPPQDHLRLVARYWRQWLVAIQYRNPLLLRRQSRSHLEVFGRVYRLHHPLMPARKSFFERWGWEDLLALTERVHGTGRGSASRGVSFLDGNDGERAVLEGDNWRKE